MIGKEVELDSFELVVQGKDNQQQPHGQSRHIDRGMLTMWLPKMAPSIATRLQYPLCHWEEPEMTAWSHTTTHQE